MRYRIIGEQLTTRRPIEIPNCEAADVVAAARLATQIGVMVSRIEPMDATVQSAQQAALIVRNVPDRGGVLGVDGDNGLLLRNLPFQQSNAGMPPPYAKRKTLRLLLAMALLPILAMFAAKGIIALQHKARVFDNLAGQLGLFASPSVDTPTAVDSRLTPENIRKIHTGMAPGAVKKILGPEDRTVAKFDYRRGPNSQVTTEVLEWCDGVCVVHCMFEDGKLVEKARSDVKKSPPYSPEAPINADLANGKQLQKTPSGAANPSPGKPQTPLNLDEVHGLEAIKSLLN